MGQLALPICFNTPEAGAKATTWKRQDPSQVAPLSLPMISSQKKKEKKRSGHTIGRHWHLSHPAFPQSTRKCPIRQPGPCNDRHQKRNFGSSLQLQQTKTFRLKKDSMMSISSVVFSFWNFLSLCRRAASSHDQKMAGGIGETYIPLGHELSDANTTTTTTRKKTSCSSSPALRGGKWIFYSV